MIYVEEKGFNRQIELLGFLSKSNDYSICAWLYPESKVSSILDSSLLKSDLEPVTTYGDGTQPKHSELKQCSGAVLENISNSKSVLSANCDSLALYKSNSNSWAAVTIGHEGMCLVRDESLIQNLINAGFNASTEAPDWW